MAPCCSSVECLSREICDTSDVALRQIGRSRYADVFRAMRDFTNSRIESQQRAKIQDELWLTEHEPVFTQGQAGRAEYLLSLGDIPVIQTDRGGQVTYHGPGQSVVYLLVDLPRAGLSIRSLVTLIQDSIISVLADYGISSSCRKGAPGVFVEDAKIASLGLRIRKGCSYHGLSLNVDMDLEPFSRIHPCGFTGLRMTQLSDLVKPCPSLAEVEGRVAEACVGRIPAFNSAA